MGIKALVPSPHATLTVHLNRVLFFCGALISSLPRRRTNLVSLSDSRWCVDHPLAFLTGSIQAVDCPDKLCRSAAPWEAGRDAICYVSSRVRLCATGRLILVALLVSFKPLISHQKVDSCSFIQGGWNVSRRCWVCSWLKILSEDNPTLTREARAGSRRRKSSRNLRASWQQISVGSRS